MNSYKQNKQKTEIRNTSRYNIYNLKLEIQKSSQLNVPNHRPTRTESRCHWK